MSILAADRLTKSFGAVRVTQDVSLDLRAGEIHALIGPNGAGKSSLIGQLAGTLAPDRRARLGLARTFQVSALVGGFSALENVALAVQARARHRLSPFGRAGRDAALNAPAHAALASAGLADRAGVAAAELAHGERRAVELACALALEPRCLLLDEPLAGMGHDEARRVVALLRGLKGRFAMLLVEHDMDAVFALADRVSVLVRGSVIACGPPDAVRRDPAVRTAYLGDDAC
jgi:branched-chain amino acid transport system ATP-binding protein